MVTSGYHTDNVCCFDFGNAETSNTDNGNGHMDAVYFGNLCWFGSCTGANHHLRDQGRRRRLR